MSYKNLFSMKNTFSILLLGIFVLATSPALFAQYVEPPVAPKVIDKTDESVTDAASSDSGMQLPVDGSSLEAFEESLAAIKESATEANYTTLENAIQWLLVYDIGVGRDKAKLAKNLNGMTGDEIVSQVEWRNKR